MCLLKELPKEICVSGIKLVLDKHEHKGIGNLKDISWYEYKIVNSDALNINYDNIAVSSFAITKEIRKLAAKNIIEERVSYKETIRPHIDYKTGNVHPSEEYIKKNNDEKVRQLVLCRGLGPKTPEINKDKNIYFYQNNPGQSACRIHKACYYPLIEEDESLKENWRYKLLAEIWSNIQEKLEDEE